ncbi:hypothetical protein [Gilvimarinus algae]|uniref:IPTL-CTERM protein sorting domain-containing protein n=1 Tax=Gilvimarinus algae TaxID=3058037 RepID=A0ABT8TDF4_9GAMM|nr:hypothetical protein [Gilvimarinus sp. SDUM040014]MDO3381594.1 hypothetical protein [Gilvimarinus sp. SDUM040014]
MKNKIIAVAFFSIASFSCSSYADVRLWVSSDTIDGSIGGRAALDTHCDTDSNKPTVAGSTTRAFISVDGADEIRDMATNYSIPTAEPILRSDGVTQIASDFQALLNTGVTNLDNSVGTPTLVWTASSNDGAVTANSCVGWTATGMNLATRGDGNSTSISYLDVSSPSACINTFSTYCITYTSTATVGGTVSGLSGSVTLQNNGADDLVVLADGPFAFSTPLPVGASYDVTVLSQPVGQSCSVSGGNGTVSGGAVTSVSVTCSASVPSRVAPLPVFSMPGLLLLASIMAALGVYYRRGR